MSKNSLRISMIIPVYNVSRFLKRCLDSCLEQDIEDYEIICIDDGSTDNSGKILDIYSANYQDRIKVVHTENKGVSEARNIGIIRSKGQYLWFIDPDDYIEKYILGNIASKLTGLDILLLPYSKIEGDNPPIHNDNYIKPKQNGVAFKDYILKHKFDKVWNYVVSKKIIVDNGLEFGRGIVLAEDYAFDFFLKEHITNWDVFTQIAYYYCIREKSASKGHEQNDDYTKRIIDNSFWMALYFNANMKKNSNLEIMEQAKKIQYDYVRSSINGSIKLGDIERLKICIKRFKECGLYPYPVRQSMQSNCAINNIACLLFNSQMISEMVCTILGLNKRFFH